MEISELEKKYQKRWSEMMASGFLPVELYSPEFKTLWEMLQIHEDSEDISSCLGRIAFYYDMHVMRYFEIFVDDPMALELVEELANYGKHSVTFKLMPIDTKGIVSELSRPNSKLITVRKSSFIVTLKHDDVLKHSEVTVWEIPKK